MSEQSVVLEPARLAALAVYDLNDARLRARLDALAQRTAAAVGQPIGLVSLVLDSAQHVAGSSGLSGWMADVGGTPVEWAFCATVVNTGRPYVVEDARVDPVQRENPLVTLDGIHTYAGVPLISADGHVLGAQCVLGPSAHRYSAQDLATLQASATEAVAILEEHRVGA